ncbi:MAG: hypothetical protein V1902_01685 [Candidatus Falkowbacteria bacterium]
MNWEKIFSLIDQVGGRHFIVDKNKEKVYVMMPLDEYEQQLAQDELVDLSDINDFVEPVTEELSEDDKAVVAKEDEQFYIEPLE